MTRDNDQLSTVLYDNADVDDTDEERTLLYGFDGPYGKIVENENNYD